MKILRKYFDECLVECRKSRTFALTKEKQKSPVMILTLSDLKGICRQTECPTSHPNSTSCAGCRFWQQYLYDVHEEQHACEPYIFARNGRTLSLEGDYNTVLAQAAKLGFTVFDLTNY